MVWQVGDLAVLRSGGFLMTISSLDGKGGVWADWWQPRKSKPQRFFFQGAMLGVPIVPLHEGYYCPREIGPKPIEHVGSVTYDFGARDFRAGGGLMLKAQLDGFVVKSSGLPADTKPSLPAELLGAEPIKRVATGQMVECVRNSGHGKHDEGLGCRRCGGS